MKILILRIILGKLQNSKKKYKNKNILRIRMLVNTSPVINCYKNPEFSKTISLQTLTGIFLKDHHKIVGSQFFQQLDIYWSVVNFKSVEN